MERRFIKERQREGIVRAKAEGAYQGGKRPIDYEEVQRVSSAGNGPASIARALGCS
jgi:DNA invertase Pin-like site-specific DNA recombinase